MLKAISFVVALLIAGLLIFAATKPDTFRVERTTSIKAPPEKIASYINDFHNWGAWSPWEKMDPKMKRTFSGTPSGVGTVYEWQGTGQVGAGRMEIMDITPSKTTIKLDFSKPFEAHNTAEYTLEPTGDGTQVTWAMFGPTPYMSKVMSVLFNVDKMVGKDFETGLANLKMVAEK